MIIEFKLTMPNVGSWNGQWTGSGNYYAIIKNIPKKIAEKILEKSSYYYRWDDGWGASVLVNQIDSKEASKLRKKTRGFCGYNWMVDSIIKDQEIKTTNEKEG